MRKSGFGREPRETGRQLEQQRQELPVSESQQEQARQQEQQPGLSHCEHNFAEERGAVPSGRTCVPEKETNMACEGGAGTLWPKSRGTSRLRFHYGMISFTFPLIDT